MHTIIWEYLVKAEYLAEFEKFYAPDGAWTKLFRKSAGYLNTELLHDSNHSRRYITIDRWISLEGYEAFLVQWQNEYQMLDEQCAAFTERESMLGNWESVNSKLR